MCNIILYSLNSWNLIAPSQLKPTNPQSSSNVPTSRVVWRYTYSSYKNSQLQPLDCIITQTSSLTPNEWGHANPPCEIGQTALSLSWQMPQTFSFWLALNWSFLLWLSCIRKIRSLVQKKKNIFAWIEEAYDRPRKMFTALSLGKRHHYGKPYGSKPWAQVVRVPSVYWS